MHSCYYITRHVEVNEDLNEKRKIHKYEYNNIIIPKLRAQN